jgi:hypothetical protein
VKREIETARQMRAKAARRLVGTCVSAVKEVAKAFLRG